MPETISQTGGGRPPRARLVVPRAYRARARAAKAEVDRLRLRRAWLAGEAGRSYVSVMETLNATAYQPGTLDRLEEVLGGIASGSVAVPDEAYRKR